jgi:hydrogenase large subunit
MPHMASIAPGGVTIMPRIDNITTSLWRLRELTEFIDNVYLPDVLTLAEVYRDGFQMGKGCGAFLSFGLFDLDAEPDVVKRKRFFAAGVADQTSIKPVDPSLITEDVRHSWYRSASHRGPWEGETEPHSDKKGAYSWLKAPRYNSRPCEVGPLARILLAYRRKEPKQVAELVDSILTRLTIREDDLCSAMGRHIARAVECKVVADELAGMIMKVQLEEPVCTPHTIPESASGMGLWCAARGALGHWITIRNGKIARYQAVVPTTWNASPADDKGVPGPIEQALLGTEVHDADNPFELARIIRSFDPCIACAVHLHVPGRSSTVFRAL